jgi:hypothetical protein
MKYLFYYFKEKLGFTWLVHTRTCFRYDSATSDSPVNDPGDRLSMILMYEDPDL